jgi:hypothetical protein
MKNMKNAIEMVSGASKYITKFHKEWFGLSKVNVCGGGIHIHADCMELA